MAVVVDFVTERKQEKRVAQEPNIFLTVALEQKKWQGRLSKRREMKVLWGEEKVKKATERRKRREKKEKKRRIASEKEGSLFARLSRFIFIEQDPRGFLSFQIICVLETYSHSFSPLPSPHLSFLPFSFTHSPSHMEKKWRVIVDDASGLLVLTNEERVKNDDGNNKR